MSQADYNLSPPFDPPIADDEDESLAWYWEETGGGFPMTFGKYEGRHMNELSLSYLLFVRENSRREDFCEAFDIYHAGLKSAVQDEYGRFKVPFGRKHIGQTIRQCRDKQWLLWASRRSNLPAKHPLFFEAVEEWFANPRHYEVLRDIGESTRHDYEADLGDDEEPTLEDEEFIDDASLAESEEDAESESEEDAEATESESGDTDEASSSSSTQMEPMKSRELSRSTKRRRTSSESSSESDDQPPLNKKSRKGRRLPVLSSPEESEN